MNRRDFLKTSLVALGGLIIPFKAIQAAPDTLAVWGKNTLQRRPTAMDRVSVRRLCFWIEKNLRLIARNCCTIDGEFYEENFKEKVASFMDDIKERKGCSDWSCAFENSNQKHNCVIRFKPTHGTEYVHLSMTITFWSDHEYSQAI